MSQPWRTKHGILNGHREAWTGLGTRSAFLCQPNSREGSGSLCVPCMAWFSEGLTEAKEEARWEY